MAGRARHSVRAAFGGSQSAPHRVPSPRRALSDAPYRLRFRLVHPNLEFVFISVHSRFLSSLSVVLIAWFGKKRSGTQL